MVRFRRTFFFFYHKPLPQEIDWDWECHVMTFILPWSQAPYAVDIFEALEKVRSKFALGGTDANDLPVKVIWKTNPNLIRISLLPYII